MRDVIKNAVDLPARKANKALTESWDHGTKACYQNRPKACGNSKTPLSGLVTRGQRYKALIQVKTALTFTT